jgi:hypothetical protein
MRNGILFFQSKKIIDDKISVFSKCYRTVWRSDWTVKSLSQKSTLSWKWSTSWWNNLQIIRIKRSTASRIIAWLYWLKLRIYWRICWYVLRTVSPKDFRIIIECDSLMNHKIVSADWMIVKVLFWMENSVSCLDVVTMKTRNGISAVSSWITEDGVLFIKWFLLTGICINNFIKELKRRLFITKKLMNSMENKRYF